MAMKETTATLAPSSEAESEPPLEARGVVARYRHAPAGRCALDGVDLVVRRGEIVMLIGPNGAGKSTLVRALAGTLAPERGEVRLFGRPLAEVSRAEIARHVAVVHQSSEVAEGFRVREVVMMGRAPRQGPMQIPSADDARVVAEAIEQAGVAHLADRAVAELSGGEQKLVAVARALAQRADVLVLDEASANLDPEHTVALYELAHRETRARGVACVAVVHDLNVAAAYADRVVLLAAGRVVAAGTVEQVMTWARLKAVFGVDLYVGVNELDGTRYFVPRRRA